MVCLASFKLSSNTSPNQRNYWSIYYIDTHIGLYNSKYNLIFKFIISFNTNIKEQTRDVICIHYVTTFYPCIKLYVIEFFVVVNFHVISLFFWCCWLSDINSNFFLCLCCNISRTRIILCFGLQKIN